MYLRKVNYKPLREMSWSLDLFWILVPFTIACGIWDLGGFETFAFWISWGICLVLGVITIMRLTNQIGALNTKRKVLYSAGQGVVWAAAMIFAWPTAWVGGIYLILILVNHALIEIKRSKRS